MILLLYKFTYKGVLIGEWILYRFCRNERSESENLKHGVIIINMMLLPVSEDAVTHYGIREDTLIL